MTWTQAISTRARASRAQREQRSILLWRIGLLLAVIVFWFAVSASGVFPEALLPNPIDVAVAFGQAVISTTFWAVVGSTLSGALAGLALGVLVGIPLGVVTGRFAAAELSTRFLVDFGRAFPAVALVAVLVLILGRGLELTVTLVFVAVVFPIVLQTQHGVRSVTASISETTRAFRIRGGLFLRKVLLPSAAPSITTGLRLAASVAILVAISTEVLTGVPGIGARITEAQLGSNSPLAYAYIFTAGLIGYLVNIGLGRLQRRILRWRPEKEGGE